MKELVGKLTALDPAASETLKVITYFDALVDGRVGVETLLRGATTLTGVPVGYRREGTTLRLLADGSRAARSDVADGSGTSVGEGDARGSYPSHAVGPDAIVWVEREGEPHANDAMVLERLAIAIAIGGTGTAEEVLSRRAVELLLDAPLGGQVDEQQRLAASARLRLDPLLAVRAVAMPSRTPAPQGRPSAILATPWGIARAAIVPAKASYPLQPDGAGVGHGARVGVGVGGTITDLPYSWRTAVIALRLADIAHPESRADDLGSFLDLCLSADRHTELLPDVATVDAVIGASWSVETLQALADGASIRSVAATAGIHHSSVHAKLPELTRRLGYDPLTPMGRARLFAALLLRRLANSRLDGR